MKKVVLMNKDKILIAWRLLYVTYGTMFIVAGLDKYFHYLVDWNIYLNHHIPMYLNLSPEIFMYFTGVIDIAIGLIVFIKPQIGGYIAALWLTIISIAVISMGTHSHEGYAHVMTHYDIALRDLVLAVGAYVLAVLSQMPNQPMEHD